MAMYLVSDEELNTIIRLRRRDVTRLIADLQEQYPDASTADILTAANQYFAQQLIAYDYLADYAAEEIAYSTPEPAAVVDEVLEEDPIVSIDEEPQNIDPLTDPDVDPNTLNIVDDTVQVVDDTTPGDAELEPAAIEEVAPEQALEVIEPTSGEVEPAVDAAREDRASRISLRALQRELKQIDKI